MAVKKTGSRHGRRAGSRGGRSESSTRTTGGGEFSESGGKGRTSETMGEAGSKSEGWKGSEGTDESDYGTSRQTRTSAGNQGLAGQSSDASEPAAGSEGRGGRYALDCAEAGEGCSLKVSGTYDEVLAAGVEHGRSAHGMKGSDEEIRDDIKGYIKEEPASTGMPGAFQGRGASQSGRSPGLPS